MSVTRKHLYSLLIMLALLVWAIQLAGYISRMYVSDDLLWYFFTGDELRFASSTHYLKADLASALVRTGADQGYIVRYDLLNRYSTNYPLVSATYAFVSSAIHAWSDYQFNQYLVRSFTFTNIIFGAVALLVVGMAAFVPRDRALQVGFVVALAVETLVSPLGAASFSPFYEKDLWSGMAGAMHHLLVPGAEFTMLNTGPRNLLSGLTLAVFLLRWSKHFTGSYWLLFGLVFVHQSTTLLVICTVVGIDLVLRPRVILKASVPIVAAVLCGVLREKVWHLTGVTLPVSLGIAGTAFATLAIVYSLQRGYVRLPKFLEIWRETIANRPPELVDPIVFLSIWLVTLPLPFFVNKYVDAYQSYYFWSVLHTRSLGVLHPSLLMGLSAVAFASLRTWNGLRNGIAAGLIGWACLLVALKEPRLLHNPHPRMYAQLTQLEQKLTGLSSIDAPVLTDGTLVYYGMIRAAEGVDDRFKRLLAAAPNTIN
ncbi:hypothetical protein [Bradyrhizobium sp. CCBAU 53380]|uniref:hypothetical protein n=1 Tax=Bradyrhizobium sp. CCBAU 53380 TaxID=1325117 RepID=UPI0023024823|nr:hypothetical protein [Bradyrhizobium sp. CCBAU 53380]MDA9421485.1 hypothetical protein [Bradyrhizobium sp. CCBAU 53380]